MTNLEIIKRMKRMDQLIKMKATGTPKEFSGRIELSKSRMYDILIDMKELGAPVRYCRMQRSYVYAEEGSLVLEWKLSKN